MKPNRFSRLLLTMLMAFVVPVSARSTFTVTDVLAPQGCAMAHCDRAMSDIANLVPPMAGSTSALWHDTSRLGSDIGLGCSANGSVAACTFTAPPSGQIPTLTVYDASGTQRWSSSLLNGSAWTSVPIIDPAGGVIAADSERVVRYDPAGNVIWNTTTAGGAPISPTFTDNGAIVLATHKGPISAYDVQSGALIGQRTLAETLVINGQSRSGTFDTVNTPAVYGNRIYISTQFRPSDTGIVLPYGRLYALDIDRTGDGTAADISVAWRHEFRAPSGASPLLSHDGTYPIIYFDGSGGVPGGSVDPHFFAVQDRGTLPQLLWQYRMKRTPIASAASDPRGGLWVYAPFHSRLLRLSPSGQLVRSIDLDALVGEPGVHVPASAMTIAGTATRPIMLVSASATDYSSSYVVAIDLRRQSLLWKYRITEVKGREGFAFGQFPIVKTVDGDPVIVISTAENGVWGLSSLIPSTAAESRTP